MIETSERDRIEDAVRRAETGTAAEIVVVVAGQAASYRSVPLLYGLVAALLTPWPLLAVTALDTAHLLIAQIAAALVLVLATMPERVRTRLVPAGIRRRRAREAAERAFAALELARTRGRTGVLVYVALAERHAEVIGDAAVAARVPDAEWRGVVTDLVDAAGRDGIAAGLVVAVDRIGAVLARAVPPGPADTDELPNRVIVL